MKLLWLFALLFCLVLRVHAGGPVAFELHAVAKQPSPTTHPYAEPPRNGEIAQKVLLENAILLDNTALRSAAATQDQDESPVIHITLTDVGAKQFADLTTKYQGQQLGFVVGGQLLSAPRILQTIRGGQLQISGNFTAEEAARMADGLNDAIKAGH